MWTCTKIAGFLVKEEKDSPRTRDCQNTSPSRADGMKIQGRSRWKFGVQNVNIENHVNSHPVILREIKKSRNIHTKLNLPPYGNARDMLRGGTNEMESMQRVIQVHAL